MSQKPSDATSQKIRTLKAILYQGHKLIHICTSRTNLGASTSCTIHSLFSLYMVCFTFF